MTTGPADAIILAMPKTLPEDVREKFTRALFILSQSDTGRYLLEEARKDGYTLSPVAADEERDFRGQASPFPRRIRLSTQLDPDIAALTLAHECAHILQFRHKLGSDPNARFPDATRLVLAAEADALAHMAQVAAELETGKGSGARFPGVMAGFARDFPLSSTITGYLLKMEPQSLDNGKLMAEVFKTFYQTPNIRSVYENGHIRNCEEAVAKSEKMGLAGSLARSLFFVRRITPQVLLDRVLVNKGRPYLKSHAPEVDLASAAYCGVTTLTKSRMVALLTRIGRKKEAVEAQRDIPTHDQSPGRDEALRQWKEARDKKSGPKP